MSGAKWAEASAAVEALLRERKTIVCIGAGGVGKTSSSAALAIRAASMGRRTLVVTIDPSKRLAEAMGIDQDAKEPVRIRENLDAWVLNPKQVSDQVVQTLTADKDAAGALLKNRIYEQITAMVSGMQEYTAVEAVHQFSQSGDYDLVILDTPPSHNALDFLQAPQRINRFLEGKVFSFFITESKRSFGLIGKAAGSVVDKVLSLSFGRETATELIEFFTLFSGLLRKLSGHATYVREFFRSNDVGFVLVVAPTDAAQRQAQWMMEAVDGAHQIGVSAVLFNRSLLAEDWEETPGFYTERGLSQDGTEVLEKWIREEREEAVRQAEMLEEWTQKADAPGLPLPWLAGGVDDLGELEELAKAI